MISRRHFLGLAAGYSGLAYTGCSTWLHQGTRKLASARVVVVGAGFGGLNVAQSLHQLAPEISITLIDRNPIYRRCPGSNEVLAGFKPESSLNHSLAANANLTGIDLLIGDVKAVNPSQKSIQLNEGAVVPYDQLVLSPGIDFRFDAIEGYNQQTSLTIPHAWSGGHQTLTLKRQLESMPQGGLFIMTVPENPYRCPPGPYERASLIAARFKTNNPSAKILILDGKSKFSKQKAFTAAWNRLYPGMIEWISMEREGRIDHIDQRTKTVVTEFGRHKADVLNVIPPQKAGRLAIETGLTDESGWCPIDPISFESKFIRAIHVIGDGCKLTPMPKSAFAAQTQARACAMAVVDQLLGRAPSPTRLINHCYSLIAQDQAVSVTGVYRVGGSTDPIETSTLAESQPGDNAYLEGRYARDWYDLILKETFGTST